MHTGALVCNFNTKMCLQPSVDKQDRWFNTSPELFDLFCMPLQFRPCGQATPLDDKAGEFRLLSNDEEMADAGETEMSLRAAVEGS